MTSLGVESSLDHAFEPDRSIDVAAPTLADQDAVWELARTTASSEVYLMWCIDYASSSLIARVDGHAVGCVVGRLSYAQPDQLTVLALEVSPEYDDSRVREYLLFSLLQRMLHEHHIREVTTTSETLTQSVSDAFRIVANGSVGATSGR